MDRSTFEARWFYVLPAACRLDGLLVIWVVVCALRMRWRGVGFPVEAYTKEDLADVVSPSPSTPRLSNQHDDQ